MEAAHFCEGWGERARTLVSDFTPEGGVGSTAKGGYGSFRVAPALLHRGSATRDQTGLRRTSRCGRMVDSYGRR
jgi:hypothetical protein